MARACIRFSTSGPMPPRIPNTLWMKSGGSITPASTKWASVVEMADVVALELEAGALLAQRAHDPFDVAEGVAKHVVATSSRGIRAPSRAGSWLIAGDHREHREVHAAHVQRAQLGREGARRGGALLERHAVARAGRDVDHHIRALVDLAAGTGRTPRGRGSGGRSRGSRACRCTIAAPASAAAIALSAICAGVIGRCGVIDGTWIAPVTAQLTMTRSRGPGIGRTISRPVRRCACAASE